MGISAVYLLVSGQWPKACLNFNYRHALNIRRTFSFLCHVHKDGKVTTFLVGTRNTVYLTSLLFTMPCVYVCK